MLTKATIDFMTELRENNDREWFHANKARYENVKKDYKSLVSKLLTAMKKHDASLATVTEKDCTFRINRDIRFSKDKSPYKTNLGIGMSTHGKRSGMGEYYVHIEPGGKGFLGGGIYMPTPEQMARIRKEMDVFGEDLDAIIAAPEFKKHYGDVEREMVLTRPPKGYSADHPHIEYLKLKSYIAITPLPDALYTDAKLVDYVVERLKALSPFLHYLNRGLTAEEEQW